jgi:hypothetical protein
MPAARPDLDFMGALLRGSLSRHKRRRSREHYSQKRSHELIPLSLNESSGIRPITIQETQSRLQQKGREDILRDLCEVPQRSLRLRLFSNRRGR